MLHGRRLVAASDEIARHQCVTLVRRDFPEANAAEFSNTGRVWCDAVYNATGLIYEPTVQTCLFDESWPAGSEDRRRLGAPADAERECAAVDISKGLDELRAKHKADLDELKAELKAAHAQELEAIEARLANVLTAKMDALVEKVAGLRNSPG